nr:AraC family transcriptional regulator [Salinispora pacifica]
MQDAAERAVDRVIDTMRNNLSDQLTVDDMARAAMFSKFHFTRIFQRVTGVSPGRFLSAIRLQEAKRLLVTTRLNVTDISIRVGYNSVGTFSTRFTKSVGLSPTTYRRMGGYTRRIPTLQTSTGYGTVRGRITAGSQGTSPGLIFMGLFQHRIPEGAPTRCAIRDEPGPFRFTDVPDGSWYLLCHAVSGEVLRLQQKNVMVATAGPLIVRDRQVINLDIQLKPVSKLDPPVLLALLDARKAAYERQFTAATEAIAA